MPVLEAPFNKSAGLDAHNFIKKRLQHSYFPVKFSKLLRPPSTGHLQWLLLKRSRRKSFSVSFAKRCSVNMQQIYRRTPMLKFDFMSAVL